MTAKEQLLQEIQHSPEPLIKEVLDFLLFAKSRNYPHSAEAKAISRLPDQDDPTKWITSIGEDEQVDEKALNAWLEKKGYQKANV
ncbi:MAG: hypothetical protein ACK6CP_05620 [Pseudanabaena sp.]|jgi:hypothetical protein|nr:hypothetical protein [Pseudanabaena sp. M090S1SP2A07QC]MCA6505443.1 hypothetical protein [Pseudanabaena sp. M172S2SP2A07QC]MCA6518456.1 hypothetical protein [Pseudanabaena sp. M110S1SP2A07QC]MCA6523302.1 hypothetical protein [Pseudanabaena sp. M051S1SP2A07QC]MCA6526045.1 hypothetical protein [Pseudanabaena sp. M179S2SP2A07QC]MCA6529003.1 hypothetical protein [Pseudanabaena sp. M125S2SP2A07QC]MCA6535345.1 hypothetical protein [Pseudanabaena sp. M176S2SP2A07QC]MCA6538056.1 hypothetical prot